MIRRLGVDKMDIKASLRDVGFNFKAYLRLCHRLKLESNSEICGIGVPSIIQSIFTKVWGTDAAALPARLFALDHKGDLQNPPNCDRQCHQILRDLNDHGVHSTHDWGIDTAALAREAEEKLTAQDVAKKPSVVSSLAPLKVIDLQLLQNLSLANAISLYFGAQVRYDAHVTQDIVGDLDSMHYSAINWHHDRCGQRLKLFVFLSNVTEHSHPTQIAKGTHEAFYYASILGKSWGRASKFSSDYISRNFQIASMTGPAGGGFIFDTNSLHRGVAKGVSGRRVVILEFHPHGKVGFMQHIGPCPSKKDNPRYFPHLQRGGVSGFDLYPNEGKL